MLPDRHGSLVAEVLIGERPVRVLKRDLRELRLADTTDLDTRVLVLLLERISELLVRLVRHHSQRRNATIGHTLVAALALRDRQAQATPKRLAPLRFSTHLAQGADLEDVRVVPALAQGRVAEHEPRRLVLVEQPFLLLHDQLVRVIVGLGRAGRVLEPVRRALLALEDREVAATQLGRILREQLLPLRRLGTLLAEQLVEPLHELTVRIVVVRAITEEALHLVDEEQGEHLDTLGAQLRLLAQMLLDRLAHHLLVDHARRSADAFALVQVAVVQREIDE